MSESQTVKNLCIEMINEIQQMKRNLKDSEDRLSYLQDRFRGELEGEFTFDNHESFNRIVESIDKLYGEKYEDKKPKKKEKKNVKRNKSLQTKQGNKKVRA